MRVFIACLQKNTTTEQSKVIQTQTLFFLWIPASSIDTFCVTKTESAQWKNCQRAILLPLNGWILANIWYFALENNAKELYVWISMCGQHSAFLPSLSIYLKSSHYCFESSACSYKPLRRTTLFINCVQHHHYMQFSTSDHRPTARRDSCCMPPHAMIWVKKYSSESQKVVWPFVQPWHELRRRWENEVFVVSFLDRDSTK
jgi:hypothetical protein